MYCITWEGILLKVDLVRIILPVILNILVFQSANLFCILSITNWKSLLVGLVWKIGNPKYLPKVSLVLMFRGVE